MRRRLFSRTDVHGEHISLESSSFDRIEICGSGRGAARLLKRLLKNTHGTVISRLSPLDDSIKNEFLHILNINAVLYIVSHNKCAGLTVYDPDGIFAGSLERLVFPVGCLRVITDNAGIYERYNRMCFSEIGACAVITDTRSPPERGLLLAASPLPPALLPHGRVLTIGGNGFNSDMDTLAADPEIRSLLPYDIPAGDFFAALAVLNSYTPLLNATPSGLICGDKSFTIEHFINISNFT